MLLPITVAKIDDAMDSCEEELGKDTAMVVEVERGKLVGVLGRENVLRIDEEEGIGEETRLEPKIELTIEVGSVELEPENEIEMELETAAITLELLGIEAELHK